MVMSPITSFRGEFFFLSNFYPAKVSLYGLTFPTSEHAYMASKTADHGQRVYISSLKTAAEAKAYGRKVTLRDGWDDMRIDVMRIILSEKFEKNSFLMDKLLATKGRLLIEGNNHGDRFWGECPIGRGNNNLGKLLMELRDDPFRGLFY